MLPLPKLSRAGTYVRNTISYEHCTCKYPYQICCQNIASFWQKLESEKWATFISQESCWCHPLKFLVGEGNPRGTGREDWKPVLQQQRQAGKKSNARAYNDQIDPFLLVHRVQRIPNNVLKLQQYYLSVSREKGGQEQFVTDLEPRTKFGTPISPFFLEIQKDSIAAISVSC